ncbi:MAG: hypothetical protein ABSH53_13840 [Holophaga sp.]|jgi:hypothetical protein
MLPHRLLRRGILGALALCGTWEFAAQPIEIVNRTLCPGQVSSDATVAGLALEIVAGTVSTPVTGFHQVPVRPGEKLVVTPTPGSDPFELEAVLEMDLGPARTERWSLRFKFGEESSVLAAVSTSAKPRLACPDRGNILTIQEGKSGRDGRSLESPSSPESLAASGLVENKARTGLPADGTTLAASLSPAETHAAGDASPNAAPSEPSAISWSRNSASRRRTSKGAT